VSLLYDLRQKQQILLALPKSPSYILLYGSKGAPKKRKIQAKLIDKGDKNHDRNEEDKC
jgi:hypothetical protein